MMRYLVPVIALLASATSAQAQMVSAADPQGMAAVLSEAGYTTEVDVDDVGDPRIVIELNGWGSSILFYGCDEVTHDGCDSIQLSTGFDRETPMDPATALEVALRWRYVAVSLDEDGDPYLRWDIVTQDGIPQAVFLDAVRRYADNLDVAAEMIFADE